MTKISNVPGLEYVRDIKQIPLKVGEKVPLFIFHPGCGWCDKTKTEAIIPIAQEYAKKGKKIYAIDGTSEEGEIVLNRLGAEAVNSFPNTKGCTVVKGSDGEPILQCQSISGYREKKYFDKLLLTLL